MVWLYQYQNNAKLCYMDTGSFTIHVKTVHKDIADDVKKDMIRQIMKFIDLYQNKWIKKSWN